MWIKLPSVSGSLTAKLHFLADTKNTNAAWWVPAARGALTASGLTVVKVTTAVTQDAPQRAHHREQEPQLHLIHQNTQIKGWVSRRQIMVQCVPIVFECSLLIITYSLIIFWLTLFSQFIYCKDLLHFRLMQIALLAQICVQNNKAEIRFKKTFNNDQRRNKLKYIRKRASFVLIASK